MPLKLSLKLKFQLLSLPYLVCLTRVWKPLFPFFCDSMLECLYYWQWANFTIRPGRIRYIPGMKYFRPIRSLVTLKFPAIDNIFHIFFLLPEIKGVGGRPHDFLTRGGGGQCPLAPPPPPPLDPPMRPAISY